MDEFEPAIRVLLKETPWMSATLIAERRGLAVGHERDHGLGCASWAAVAFRDAAHDQPDRDVLLARSGPPVGTGRRQAARLTPAAAAADTTMYQVRQTVTHIAETLRARRATIYRRIQTLP